MLQLKRGIEEYQPLLGQVKTGLDVESDKRISYPIAAVFILVTKFFEAISANGIRTILALYLRDDLNFSQSLAIIMLHVFNFFGQFCPIFGAIIADSYVGNTRTVSYFFVLYAVGWIGLILTSISLKGLIVIFLIVSSLVLLSVGNGSIRACITSLGASQFQIPEQNSSLTSYFSHYYSVYYLGIFLSKVVPPTVRANFKCFGRDQCYAAVFLLLASAFIISWIIFMCGKFFYKREFLTEKNILLKVFNCIHCALVKKYKNSQDLTRKEHWLNYAADEYSEDFIHDVKTLLKVSKLFIPLPIYYALLAQQDSTWTFQATQLNTTVFNITIEADQAKAMGPLFLFVMIPLWRQLCLPLLNAFNFTFHPLHSVAVGGICSGLAFISSGLLQRAIENESVARSISFLWQIPQFILLMMGELFLSIPGLEFSFTQAPTSMKSVLTAAWFLNNAFGNLIVVLMTEIIIVQLQSSLYFVYAIMMFISTVFFTIMALDYLKRLQPSN